MSDERSEMFVEFVSHLSDRDKIADEVAKFFAKLRNSLMDKGFTREESMIIVSGVIGRK